MPPVIPRERREREAARPSRALFIASPRLDLRPDIFAGSSSPGPERPPVAAFRANQMARAKGKTRFTFSHIMI
jgi:hypothetical protein